MAERELTNKEQQFAKAVASGSSQCEAYSRVYSADASRATKRANGHNVSKRPRVAKEIKRLRRLPAVDDYAGIKAKMIERLLEIAENDARATARHHAIIALLRYCEEGAARQVTSDPETDIAALVRELTADVEVRASLDRIVGDKTLADGDLAETPSVQVSEPHVEEERDLLLDTSQLTRPVNPAYAAAEAKRQAFRAMRDGEARGHEESVRRSRVEVRRLAAIYAEQREAAPARASVPANGDEREEARDFLIDESACTAVPRPYLPASGPRPGYRLEAVRGRFPTQYRWVPAFEGDDS
jgi:hypothetical protein